MWLNNGSVVRPLHVTVYVIVVPSELISPRNSALASLEFGGTSFSARNLAEMPKSWSSAPTVVPAKPNKPTALNTTKKQAFLIVIASFIRDFCFGSPNWHRYTPGPATYGEIFSVHSLSASETVKPVRLQTALTGAPSERSFTLASR